MKISNPIFPKLRNIILEKDNIQLYSALTSVKATVDENIVVFNSPNKFAYTLLTKNENSEMLRSLVNDMYGDGFSVKIEYVNDNNANENRFESHMLNNNVPFTNID